MKKIFLIACFSILTIGLHATTHYASRAGTAAFIVSSETSPMTLSFALNSALPGDSVLLTGDFTFAANEIFIGEKEDIYYGTYGGGATLIGSDNTDDNGITIIVVKDSKDITIEGFTIRDNYGQNARALFVYGSGENISVINNTIEKIGWTTTDNYLTDPVAAAISAQNGSSNAIIIFGNHYPGVATNISVTDTDDDGKLRNITISGNTLDSLVLGTSEAITVAGNVEGFEVSNNIVTDVSNIAIDAAGHFDFVQPFEIDPLTGVQYLPFIETIYSDLNQAREGVINNNTITNAVSQVAVSAGIYCDGCKDVIIRNNLVIESGTGFSIGCEVGGGKAAENVSLVNNIARDNQQSGMFIGSITSEGAEELSIVQNCIIRNNVLYNNNTLGSTFSNNFSIALSKGDSNEISNNIIHLRENIEGSTTNAVGITVFDGISPNITNYTITNNLFYRTSGSTVTIAEQLNANGSGLTISNSVVADPDFLDLTNNLFDIPETSPAANAGSTITLIASETDFDGDDRIQGDIVDIGAQESAALSIVSVTGITVSPDTILLIGGGSEQLTATVAPLDATDQTVTWSTGDASIATVSTSGLITAVSIGSTTITATSTDGGFIDTSVVTISAAATVYDFPGYSGYEVDLIAGTYTLSDLLALGINDNDISSLRIEDGYEITLYYGENFDENELVRSSDENNLFSLNFGYHISSLKIEAAGSANVVSLFDLPYYSNYFVALGVGSYTLSDFSALGINNDDISSLTVAEGYKVTLYQHDNFAGSSLVRTSDTNNLWWYGFGSNISSIIIEVDSSSSSRLSDSDNNTLEDLTREIEISVYPNPVSNILNIAGLQENQSIQIYNTSGRLILKTDQAQINVTSFDPGVYFIKIDKQQTKKFIKK